MKFYRAVFALTLAVSLAACGSANVKVSPLRDFPKPLVEPMPLNVGVYYSEGFRSFVYDESTDSQGEKETIIDLGTAQVSLFEQVLPSVFAQVQVLNDLEHLNWPAGLDAVLVPSVADVEYSVPFNSKAKVYEVWIKYQFKLLLPDGSTITDWTMPAYGKTPTAFLKSSEQAINLASLMALRDSGAAFVTGFPRVPEVAQLIDQVNDPAAGGVLGMLEENNHD